MHMEKQESASPSKGAAGAATRPNRPARQAGRADVGAARSPRAGSDEAEQGGTVALVVELGGHTTRDAWSRTGGSVEPSSGGAPRRGRSARGRPGSLGF